MGSPCMVPDLGIIVWAHHYEMSAVLCMARTNLSYSWKSWLQRGSHFNLTCCSQYQGQLLPLSQLPI